MKHIVEVGKKLSLLEIKEAEDSTLHNSNMLNLVSAINTIDNALDEMQKEIKRLTDLKAEIITFSNDDRNLQNTREVSRLYNETKAKHYKPDRY